MKAKPVKSKVKKTTAHKTQPNNHAKDIDDEKSGIKKQIFFTFSLGVFLLIATALVVLYARGYRLLINQKGPSVSKTGILNIISTPTSSQVYINDHLTTATNSTINLTPNKYTVKIAKDGYYDFQKDVQIEKEVVTGIDALLFPKSPSLQSISTFGVDEALIDPSGTKLAFKIASQSAKRNGIYILDMTARTVPILQGQSSSSQIADDTVDKFSTAHLSWSPDSKELIASISAVAQPPTNENTLEEPSETTIEPAVPSATYYLLKTNDLNESPQDITATIDETLDLWNTQLADREKSRQKSLKPKIAAFSKKYFKVLSWSPDDKKILYQASESAQMPVFLKPRRIGNNLLYERRDLTKNAIYVYDTTEDINTRIIDVPDENPSFTFNWFPDSEHLIYVNDKKIQLVDTDGANLTTIYAGPFISNFVFPWPDGSKLVILTNLGNVTNSPTLYTIGLK